MKSLQDLKGLLHWIGRGRSGAKQFVLFPDASELGQTKRKMPSKKYKLRKTRLHTAKMSRKRNR